MASRLSPAQLLILISHTAPLQFDLFCGRQVTLVFQGDRPEEVATCDIDGLADVRSGIAEMGYTLVNEWRRGMSETGLSYAKQ